MGSRYMFTGYRNVASPNIKPAVTDALNVGADVDQPVGTAASGRGIKLGGVMLAMDANTASCMNFQSDPHPDGTSEYAMSPTTRCIIPIR